MAHKVVILDTHVEVTFSGAVDRETLAGGMLTAEERDAVARLRRVLFDLCAVTSFGLEPVRLGEAMQRMAAQGIRLAICSEAPAMFGVGRQIALSSDLEGLAMMVARTRAEAVRWLELPD